MHNVKYSSLIIILALIFGSCKKDALSISDCDNLKKGLIAEDVNIVRKALKDELTFYSRDNLNKLSVTISNQCNIAVSVGCYNCIYTNPAQSELKVLLNQSGISIGKVIDITYTSTNKMSIVGVHN